MGFTPPAGLVMVTRSGDVFLHRLTPEIEAVTAAIGGLDVLVMTGGIGEHVPLVSAQVAARPAYLGVDVHPDAAVLPSTATSPRSTGIRP